MTTDNYGNECAGELEAQLAQGEWQPVGYPTTWTEPLRIGTVFHHAKPGMADPDLAVCRRVARPAQEKQEQHNG